MPIMNIYVAASCRRIKEARQVADVLLRKGHSVTSTWLSETYEPDVELTQLTPQELMEAATLDLADIDRSDAIVFLSEDSIKQPPRGSRHVEFGYALANGCNAFVIGSGPENLFHYLPFVRVLSSVEDMPVAIPEVRC